MPALLNPLRRLAQWRFRTRNSEKLYGAIVAQARLPAFYRSLPIPDNLQGRFGLLALNLFAVLHVLKEKEGACGPLAQDLVDRFSKDMETVLREMGVSDLAVPKKMRALARSAGGLLEDYEAAFRQGEGAFAMSIASGLQIGPEGPGLTSGALASYVRESIGKIGRQPLAELEAGKVDFAPTAERR
jgi:cytochrome b pre-mRNA-processing protein 3